MDPCGVSKRVLLVDVRLPAISQLHETHCNSSEYAPLHVRAAAGGLNTDFDGAHLIKVSLVY